MSRFLVSRISTAVTRYILDIMSEIKYPDFLNTGEKYDRCVGTIHTVKQFEEVFYKVLDDDNIPLDDAMKIMERIEEDVIINTGNKDICCVLEVADAIINYHLVNMKNWSVKEPGKQTKTATTNKTKTKASPAKPGTSKAGRRKAEEYTQKGSEKMKKKRKEAEDKENTDTCDCFEYDE